MKLLTFVAGPGPRLGALLDEEIADLNMARAAYLAARGETLPYETAAATVPPDLLTLLQKGEQGLEAAREALAPVAEGVRSGANPVGPRGERILYRLEEVALRAPIARPQKIIGIGLNYRDHAAEAKVELPKVPRTFAMFANALVGPGENIVIPKTSDQVDWEAELVAVVGRRARLVAPEEALEYLAGYTAGNDVSVRDLQRADPSLTRGKSGDTHAPLGPWVVTRDEIPDPGVLDIELRVNGVVKQSSNTRNLVFSVSELVAFLSRYFTLEPGDLIYTGTSGGVAAYRNPPEWLKPGDRVDVTIQGIGTLTNCCVAE